MTLINGNSERDIFICQDYASGKEINELSRTYGLSERRVSQILTAADIVRRPRKGREKQALSRLHARIGLHLYHYAKENGFDKRDVANDLEKTAIHVGKVYRGLVPLELLDLLDIAAYTQTSVAELIKDG